MYEHFYGLRERPFELTPNPDYLFLTSDHREALTVLQYGISSRKGLTMLIGEAGTGKTMLVRTVLARKHDSTHYVYLNNPTLTRSEFVEFLADAFRFNGQTSASKSVFLSRLKRALLERHSQGVGTALVIDEAQSLTHELLEEIRLLANIDTATDHLLSVVLAGQPELADRLNDPSLRQLKQRIALRCRLQPLTLEDTAAYIASRIRVAGGTSSDMFTRGAVITIHQLSHGIPRSINVICDNALVSGLAADRRLVDRQVVQAVCRDLDIDVPMAAPRGRPTRRASSSVTSLSPSQTRGDGHGHHAVQRKGPHGPLH